MLFPLSYGGSYFILDTNRHLVERPPLTLFRPKTTISPPLAGKTGGSARDVVYAGRLDGHAHISVANMIPLPA